MTGLPDTWIVPVREGVEYMRDSSGSTNDDLLALGQNSTFGCEKLASPPFTEYDCNPLAPCR